MRPDHPRAGRRGRLSHPAPRAGRRASLLPLVLLGALPLVALPPASAAPATRSTQVARATEAAPAPPVGFTRTTTDLGGDRRPVAGDFDGDGDTDLLWYGDGPDQLALGDPSATFTTSPLTTPDGHRPAAGDFDGDGNDDLLWYGDGPDELALGRPDHTFTTVAVTVPGSGTPLVGDFDGDGNDDALWYRPGPAADPVLYGGPGGAVTRVRETVDASYRAFTGDFDGDARADVFWYGPGAAPDRVWYGSTGRTFTSATVRVGGDLNPVVANFNTDDADVRTDVLWYGRGAAADSLWRGTATRGTFATGPVERGGDVRAVTGDFDGSGGADVAWYRPAPGTDQLWTSTRRPRLTVEVFLDDADLPDGSLGVPWDLAWTPDGALLFDERSGDLDVRLPDGTVRQLVADQSDVYAVGEGGVTGLVVDPAFATNRRFYTCQGRQSGAAYDIQVVAWQVDAGYTTATRVADPLVGGLPVAPPSAPSPGRHSGCRLRFGPDGELWIGTGDTAVATLPQDRASLGGKILRVDAVTGAAAPGNPFVGDGDPATDDRVFNYGHRNVQGLALRPGTHQMWSVEHGTFRDDEVNRLYPGANYGWDPVPLSDPVFYDESRPMTDLVRHPGSIVAARSSGNPTNAWSGAQFLVGEQWGTWEGALAVGVLKDSQLRIMWFTRDGAYVRQEIPAQLDHTHGRLRTPMQGPDGSLYLTTSEASGNVVLRVTPS